MNVQTNVKRVSTCAEAREVEYELLPTSYEMFSRLPAAKAATIFQPTWFVASLRPFIGMPRPGATL